MMLMAPMSTWRSKARECPLLISVALISPIESSNVSVSSASDSLGWEEISEPVKAVF